MSSESEATNSFPGALGNLKKVEQALDALKILLDKHDESSQ